MRQLLDLDDDYIRAIACGRFTDLVVECSRLRPELVLGLSVVGGCLDDSTISQHVYVAAISRAPFHFHKMVGSLGRRLSLEHNLTPAAANRGKNIEPTPSIDAVRRARWAALGRR